MNTIYHLPPGTFVELNDLILNIRKLGLVDETGLGYYDLHADGELPKPLQAANHPVGVGSITSWISALSEDDAEPWMNVWEALTERNLDVLTIARGIRWGMENSISDVDLLQKMGEAAADQIRVSRATVERAIAQE